MHFTSVLCRRFSFVGEVKRIWRRQGKFSLPPLEIPPELKEMGVKVHDALDVASGKECMSDETPALPLDASEMKKYYLFDKKVKVSHYEAQALALTKTISYDGLPPVIMSLLGKEMIPDQDVVIQNALLQALVRDARQDRLPKVIDVKNPDDKYLRVYGPRYKRKAANLMQKFAFLCEMACGKFPESLLRARNIDAFTEDVIERGGDTVVFQLSSDILVSSQKPLMPFASPEEVESTKDVALPSIYPVKPTLDLWQHTTNPCIFTGIDALDANVTRNLHIHTLHVVQKSFGYWFPAQKAAKAIATCFAFATEEARRLYGEDVKVLPEPVTVQCVYSDVQVLGFVAYQLNTLDLSHDNGIKNQVWLDGEHNLYSEISELKGIKDYDSQIFPKMLAFYLNGVHPLSL